jgi:excisionase family DNA binding protein
MKPDEASRYLDANDVAIVLNCSKKTVYRLIESGELAAVRISPKLLRVHPDALRAYLSKKAMEYEFSSGNPSFW